MRGADVFTELTAPMINEFIEKIIVHAPEKIDGDRFQQVDIYLKFIGRFELPPAELTPEEEKRQATLRCELNRQIRRDNMELRIIKREIESLKATTLDIIPTLENLRTRLIILMYQLLNIGKGKANIKEYLSNTKPKIARFTSLVNRIKAVENERRAVVKEKKIILPNPLLTLTF